MHDLIGSPVKAIFLVFCLVGLLCATGAAAAATAPDDTRIAVTGNRHTDADVIRAHFHSSSAGAFDAAALDAALKSLYATGLFADVKISRDGERVAVAVVENPTIGRVAFEGNRKIKDDDLTKGLLAKTGRPLARAIVHDDVAYITAFYRQRGYFDVKVEPKTIAAGEDRVNLVFEITEGRKLAVRQIVFAGNVAFSANKLKGAIKTGETNLLSFLLDNDSYDADRIENDCDLLRRFYRAHGYADVRVRASGKYEDGKGVMLTYTIEEGELYRLGRVDIVSRLKNVDAAPLRRYLRTQAGGVYDADATEKTVSDLALALARSGESFANVTARSDRVPGQRVIDLVYLIDAGNRVYVERIEIRGNAKTRDGVVRREFDLAEGDAYNTALVDRAERRLKALGYFKLVKIAAKPGSAPDRVILDVALEEQNTGNYWLYGGYSASSGPMIETGVSDRNLFGTGAVAKASFTLGEYARGFDLSYVHPYWLDQRLSLGFDVFANQSLASPYQSFDSTVYGGKVSVGMPINDEVSMQWTYSLYNQGLSLDPAMGPASLPIAQAAAAGPAWVSAIGTGLTYSTLDDARNPTNGVRAQFNDAFAGLGGAVKFAQVTDDVRYYHEIVGDVVGMVRTQGGYVTPWGGQQLPLLNGFFGGPQLVRGFAPDGFGPRDITPGTTQDNVGGNVYWTTSAELQAPMPFVPAGAQLKVAVFADAGSLWATNGSNVANLASTLSPSQQIANPHALQSSIGASVIWDSMFGPLRVDYAYPLTKQSYDVTQRLNFTAGFF